VLHGVSTSLLEDEHLLVPNMSKTLKLFLISNIYRVLNVVCFLLDGSPVYVVEMPSFQNTLCVPSS
jgi:hypothetical protein